MLRNIIELNAELWTQWKKDIQIYYIIYNYRLRIYKETHAYRTTLM